MLIKNIILRVCMSLLAIAMCVILPPTNEGSFTLKVEDLLLIFSHFYLRNYPALRFHERTEKCKLQLAHMMMMMQLIYLACKNKCLHLFRVTLIFVVFFHGKLKLNAGALGRTLIKAP